MKPTIVKGYKASRNMVCRGLTYRVGKIHTMKESPIICQRGFHFCKNAKDVLNYYGLSDDFVLLKVEAHGEIEERGDKCSTNKLKIVSKLSKAETADLLGKRYGTVAQFISQLKLPKAYKDLVWLRFKQGRAKMEYRRYQKASLSKKFLVNQGSVAEDLIGDLFTWSDTPEGYQFWSEVYDSVRYPKYSLPAMPDISKKDLKLAAKAKKAKKKIV